MHYEKCNSAEVLLTCLNAETTGVIYGKFSMTPFFFLKWPNFFKLSGPFVQIDLISGKNILC